MSKQDLDRLEHVGIVMVDHSEWEAAIVTMPKVSFSCVVAQLIWPSIR